MLENAWLVVLVVGSVALMPLLIGNIRREIEWHRNKSKVIREGYGGKR
jgi:hypothetical protein